MRGKFAFAPPPRFGEDNIARFRHVSDAYGNQFDADYFAYTIFLTSTDAAVIAANATVIKNIPFELDSVFEWKAMTLSALDFESGGNTPANGINVTLVDQTSSRALMSGPTPMANIGAFSTFPNILPVTRRFMPGTNLQAVFTDSLGDGFSEFALTLHGRKLYTQGMPPDRIPRFNMWQDQQSGLVLCEDLFWQNFGPVTVDAGDTVDVYINGTDPSGRVEVESDFQWIESTACAENTNHELFNDPADMLGVTVFLRDKSSGRYLMNEPVPIYQYAGGTIAQAWGAGFNAGIFAPFVIPEPRIWPAGTQPVLTVTNNGSVALTNFTFTMGGRKIFEQD